MNARKPAASRPRPAGPVPNARANGQAAPTPPPPAHKPGRIPFAVFAPAVRMVAVAACVPHGLNRLVVKIHPVVAIEAYPADVYADGIDTGPDYRPLVVNDSFDINSIVPATDLIGDAMRIASAPWSPENDESRLAEDIRIVSIQAKRARIKFDREHPPRGGEAYCYNPELDPVEGERDFDENWSELDAIMAG